ncbi:MAG: hypothetical protein AAF676_14575 [Pseudomonadota bacterium]
MRRPVATAQYTPWAFGNRCRAVGIRPSTETAGNALHNAMCESFVATLECALLDRHRFATKAEARVAVFRFIAGFYDPSCRHSITHCPSPAEFQATHQSNRATMGTSKPEYCP